MDQCKTNTNVFVYFRLMAEGKNGDEDFDWSLLWVKGSEDKEGKISYPKVKEKTDKIVSIQHILLIILISAARITNF